RRGRSFEVRPRNDALGKVVEPLEAVTTCYGDLPRREQVLERTLRRLPAPHPPAALPLEGTRGQRAALANRVEDERLAGGPRALSTPPVPGARVDRPPLEQRVVLDGNETGLVRPVLEDRARAEEPADAAGRVPAEPRAECQPVRPVDR